MLDLGGSGHLAWPVGDHKLPISYEEDGITVSPAELVAAGGRVLALLEREAQARHEVAVSMLGNARDWWASGDRNAEETPLTLELFEGLMRLDTIMIQKAPS